jgi:hypothetical protein
MDTSKKRTGVLVVSAWTEDRTSSALRARLTRSTDVRSPQLVVTAAAGVEGICQAVRAWLEEFLAS